MLIKSSIVVYIKEEEELFIDDVIQEYENGGWRVVLEKELFEDDSNEDYTWMLGFAKNEEKEL